MNNFLEQGNLPILNQESRDNLEAKITPEEISQTIKSLKSG